MAGRSFPKLPYRIGAPSMVFGKDVLKNVLLLKDIVNHIEIVLFYTPNIHNIPGLGEMRTIKKIGKEQNVTFSVHLPASLEMASENSRRRKESVQLAMEIGHEMTEFGPRHFILHIPVTPPTLVAVPGLYFTSRHQQAWDEWTKRASESLETLLEEPSLAGKLLVENINYSPSFLEPFWNRGLCGFCLDLGHLLLGREKVLDVLKKYLHVTQEIHLHGVNGDDEHLSLSIIPEKRVHKWLGYIRKAAFQGVMILEVFSPQDLTESMDILLKSARDCSIC